MSFHTAYAAVDLKAVVEQSVLNYQRDWRVAGSSWICTETDVSRSHGTTETDVSEVIPVDGTPYERPISKDGIPPSPAQQRMEDSKYREALRQRQAETPSQRAARILKYENERAFAKDIPRAYNYKLMGEDMVNGRPAWVIAMTPRPDFTPTTPRGSMLRHFDGTLWIDKEDLQWSKAEAHAIDTIGIGWILARVKRGTRIELDQTRVAPGLWLPGHITIVGSVRVMLLYSKPIDEEVTWSEYRRATGGGG